MMRFFISLFLFCCVVFEAGAEAFRWRASLNGTWQFAATYEPATAENLVWRDMTVPSNWGSYGRRQWANLEDAAGKKYGYYKVCFPVPAEWNGKRIFLQFDQIEEAWSVAVNGTVMKESPNRMLYAQVDVTDGIQFGEDNELVVKTELAPPIENADWHYDSYQGLGRDVWIMAVPAEHIRFSLIDTSVRKHEIHVRTQIAGDILSDMSVRGVVLDGEEKVLELPEVEVGSTGGWADMKASWENPELWGFGEYGTQKLYTLRVELLKNGDVADVKHERFGFREFYAEGDRFMFNGKLFRILGDLITATWETTDHFASATAYFQWMRDNNFNFLRFHSSDRLDNEAAMFAADELGMLVQPEMQLPRVLAKHCSPMHPAVVEMLENYIRANYNHPSIVSWCLNNESFSVGLTTPENVRKIKQPLMKEYDALISRMKTVDLDRIFEINHNYTLWAYVRQKKFSRENFQVFNIHPYGDLKAVINGEEKALGFKGEVPVLVGEIFAFDEPLDFNSTDAVTFCEQRRVGLSMQEQIASALSADHVAGVILCGLSGNGRNGYYSLHERKLGPWSHLADVTDENGKRLGIQKGDVLVKWPSLSGPGNKVDYWMGYREGGGDCAVGTNWFDSNVPIYYPNIVDLKVREAMEKANGGTMPPLSETRPAEVIAAVGDNGVAAVRQYVWLENPLKAGELEGVMTDEAGTAWFRIPETGHYALRWDGKEKNIEISSLPGLKHEAGYDYVTWVDMGGIDTAERAEALKAPAGFRKRVFMPRKETDSEVPALQAGPFSLSEHGFVRDVLVLGPFQNFRTETGWQADTTDYLAALGGECNLQPSYQQEAETVFDERSLYVPGTYTLKWRQMHSSEDILDFTQGAMSLEEAGVVKGMSYAAGYIFCIVNSPDDRKVRFGLGSDDGYILYVNGTEIGRFLGGRGTIPNEETYEGTLKTGQNFILMKVIQQVGGWSTALSITQPDGTPCQDLTISLQ